MGSGFLWDALGNDGIKVRGKFNPLTAHLSKIPSIQQKGDSKHPLPIRNASGSFKFGPLNTEFKLIILVDGELVELTQAKVGEVLFFLRKRPGRRHFEAI